MLTELTNSDLISSNLQSSPLNLQFLLLRLLYLAWPSSIYPIFVLRCRLSLLSLLSSLSSLSLLCLLGCSVEANDFYLSPLISHLEVSNWHLKLSISDLESSNIKSSGNLLMFRLAARFNWPASTPYRRHAKLLPEGRVVLTFWPLSRKLKLSSSANFATRATCPVVARRVGS